MRIWNILFITLVFILLADFSSAQKTGPVFLDKTHQNILSAEFMAVSYSYAHKFNKNAILGINVMSGWSCQIFLASSSLQYSSDPVTYYKPSGSDFEVLKLKFFYRPKLSNRIYIDVGPFISITNLSSDAEWVNPFSAGIEFSPSVIVWKLHLGIALKGAVSFGDNYSSYSSTYYAIYIIPIVIGFGF